MGEQLVGQRGTITGEHRYSGHRGEIVKVERTTKGWAAIVRLEGGVDCTVFLRHLRAEWRRAPRVDNHSQGRDIRGGR